MSANLAVLEISALLRSGATNQAAIKAFQIDLLSEFQKKQFQFIWDVSRDSGGNLALALDRLAQVFDSQHKQSAELKVAFAKYYKELQNNKAARDQLTTIYQAQRDKLNETSGSAA